MRLKVGAVEGGAGEDRGAKQCSVSFQLASRIAANWKQMLMISVEYPPATLGLVLRAGASWKHAHHWAASPPLARQPHPVLITPDVGNPEGCEPLAIAVTMQNRRPDSEDRKGKPHAIRTQNYNEITHCLVRTFLLIISCFSGFIFACSVSRIILLNSHG